MPTVSYTAWTPELITGHSKIDAQHQTLFESFYRLRNAIESGSPEEEVSRCLSFLKAYARVHFETEEALYATQPDLDASAHIAEHRQILGEVSVLLQRNLRGEHNLSSEAVELIERWTREHILRDDCRLLKQVLPQ